MIYWPKNSKNSRIQQWNVQIEQALGSSMSWNLAYVGTKVANVATPFNANGTIYNPGQPASKWFANVGTINEYGMIGSANYNGLQTKLTRRMSNGLLVTAAYTWSHAMDNSADTLSNAPNGIVMGANGVPLLHYQYGNSNNDQRHLFAGSALYELPFGRGKMFGRDISKELDYVVGGWQWNNVVILATGTPMDIQGAGTLNGRPDYHGGCSTDVSTTVWISCTPGAFTDPGSGTIGNLPRNYFFGPGTHTWDMALTKNVRIAERVNTELRAQLYNVTNTPQFQIPETHFTYGNFGQLNASSVRLSPTNRELELAVRISF